MTTSRLTSALTALLAPLDRNPGSLSFEQKLHLYEIFRDYLKHEDGLRGTRIGWLLTSQAFFFAAEATFFSVKHPIRLGIYFQALIAILGLSTSILHWLRSNQQDRVYDALEKTYGKLVDRFSPSNQLRSLELGDMPPLRYAGVVTKAGRSPYAVSYHVIFACTWFAVISLLIFHYMKFV